LKGLRRREKAMGELVSLTEAQWRTSTPGDREQFKEYVLSLGALVEDRVVMGAFATESVAATRPIVNVIGPVSL
jgi:hypothetical protein